MLLEGERVWVMGRDAESVTSTGPWPPGVIVKSGRTGCERIIGG